MDIAIGVRLAATLHLAELQNRGTMTAPLGIIEGYYGTPWSWEARNLVVSFLAAHDYRFYLYAPKADRHLRKKWREEHPAETSERLAALAAHCKSRGVRFGV